MTNVDQQIAEAALAEGLAPMPEDLIPLQEEKLLLDKQLELLNSRVQEIKDAFSARLVADGLQAYTLHGNVHARRSEGTRTSVDSKKLKAEMPHVYSKFLKVTKYVSIRIS